MSQSFTELGTIQYHRRSWVGTLPYVANLPLRLLDIVRGGRVYPQGPPPSICEFSERRAPAVIRAPPGSGSVCQRSFTSFRMTSLASVILSEAKNLSSCRAMTRM